ncbi:MAG: class I SAM-dependent methyltransferase [Deltaproteobacteria bacterium]|nr:class I SAM-dependent methyltransferase [Deltaproteobacteria bacterium]MBN2670172.1 class I SAM-dependent methyltransferase [Deltaproteobacteria bacterium]
MNKPQNTMDALSFEALAALENPIFYNLFSEFLELQRYDLIPYIRHFRTLSAEIVAEPSFLTVDEQRISAASLVSAYLEFILNHFRKMSFDDLCRAFQQQFHPAIADGGPLECRTARESLDPAYARHFIWPLFKPAIASKHPGRILDFGCGQNGFSRVLQTEMPRTETDFPIIFGVDVQDAHNAWQDPSAGIFYFDLKKQSLEDAIDQPVDLIFVNFVFHHMEISARNETIPKLAALLSPGGILAVAEASVDTDADDDVMFAQTTQNHPVWQNNSWNTRYLQWSTRFLSANPTHQHYLMRLEDLFGHRFLYPNEIDRPVMPMPFSFLSRNTLAMQLSQWNIQFVKEESSVFGLPPLLKYGPPTSLWIFKKDAA